jgi:hypothetical protein
MFYIKKRHNYRDPEYWIGYLQRRPCTAREYYRNGDYCMKVFLYGFGRYDTKGLVITLNRCIGKIKSISRNDGMIPNELVGHILNISHYLECNSI